MGQVVWFQDFEKSGKFIKNNENIDNNLGDFGKRVCEMLIGLGFQFNESFLKEKKSFYEEDVTLWISNFNFKNTDAILLCSLPGYYE